MIFEVKIDSHRQLEDTQRLLGKPKGYQRWLERRKGEKRDVWLIYLVPGDWLYLLENNQAIREYQLNSREQAINVRTIYWEKVLQILSEDNSRSRCPFVEEFRLLLSKRFGPINFCSKEIKSMFAPEFPMETLVKLNAVLEGLKNRFAKKETISVSEIYESGFELVMGGISLFVGLSLEFWNAGHHYPVCFGVPDKDAQVREAFSQAFRKVYKQEPFSIAEMGWTMGWVTQEDFNRFEKDDAINEIWIKLALIWDSVKQAK
jgi:hypothetical protein